MAYDNTMKIEFYKPKYNLDIKFDGDDSFDLLFKNVSGELFFSADVEDYDSYVSFEDEECKFTNGELVAKVDISDLMETIANGQLRNTNGTTYGEWIPRIVGDYKTEHDLVFDGKTYADRGYWELFFKEMSKDEIKDFIEFCRDYIDIPNLEFSSRNFNFDDKGYIIISDDNYSNAYTYSLTINDDLTIEMAHKFICKSLDAIGVWEMNHDYGDEFEEKKSIKKSLKEEKVTDSLFSDVVFSMIKKFKLKKEYDVERPNWSVFNFRHKNKDAQFAITFDKRGHGDFLYGDVLAFGDEKDDIFKYKTDEVKIDSYNIEKECLNVIADCLAFISTNKKITIFESKKSARKSLKERDDTIFSKDVKRWMLSGNDINITFKDGNELVGAIYEHRKDFEDKKAECFLCEDLTSDYTGDYFIVEVYNGKISEIKFQSYDWLEHYMDDSYDLMESKKSVKKSLKEEAMTTKLFRFIQDLYDVHYITEEQLNKFRKHDFSKKEIKVLEQNYEIYKTSNEFDEINNAIKSTVNMINSFKESLKESTDESFSLYDLNKHDPFVKEWIKNINKELKDVSIESIGDDEIVFRVWFDENIDLDIFDDTVTDCMPRTLIKFMSDMNIDFGYQFVYEDNKFTENDYVFIRFVAW